MEQPGSQNQTEIRPEMINQSLICCTCLTTITTLGECECHELFTIGGGDYENTIEVYREVFLSFIKHFIRTEFPNLSPLDENIVFRNDTDGTTYTCYFASNGLRVEVRPWASEIWATQDQELSIASNVYSEYSVYERPYELATSGNQENVNHNIEQSLITNRREGNTSEQENRNYLQLRQTMVTFMSREMAVIFDILGQHLDWQHILRHVESDTIELRWRLYEHDFGFNDGYDHIDYSEFDIGNHYVIGYSPLHTEENYVFNSNAREFGNMISFGGHDYIEYQFPLNTTEEYEDVDEFALNAGAQEYVSGFGEIINFDGYGYIVYDFPLNAAEEYEIIVPDDDNFNSGLHPASNSAIESLLKHVISFDSGDECCICTDPIAVGDEAKILPCNHFYHSECIIKWLGISNACPLCRYQLPSKANEDQRQN